MVHEISQRRSLNRRRSKKGKSSFIPSAGPRPTRHWMHNFRDWCISRQLWWGHRVPVWYRTTAPTAKAASTDPKADFRDRHRSRRTRKPIRAQVDILRRQPSWEQDPDVLDTWVSSWLWPFATMGWPEQTETLKKFYPTTDLVTGPDIIFFWVARMIMAGYEYMGELPFHNVYFTGIIRDKLGPQDEQEPRQLARPAGAHRQIRR